MRGATHLPCTYCRNELISIHAPRAGSDARHPSYCLRMNHFNPRSPCGERPVAQNFRAAHAQFQSTLPVRGATRTHTVIECPNYISIHAPRAGSDYDSVHPRTLPSPFQSTLPVRGATPCAASPRSCHGISIHAPRAGSDGCVRGFLRNRFISIHAPRAGSDKETDSEIRIPVHFNPRSPCGERPVHVTKSGTLYRFQSTLPVRGATRPLRFCAASNLHFNPRSPCGERRATRRKISCCMKFQSTLPVRGAT